MDPNLPTSPEVPDSPGQPVPDPPPPSALSASLSGRSFAFFPPIRNVQHNQWQFVRETWAETLVANTESGEEVWIPRRLLGTLSPVDQPIPIVGLQKELELRAGAVWPYRTKLLEMPAGKRNLPATEAALSPAARSSARHGSSRAEHRVVRLIGLSLFASLAVILAILAVYRGDGIFGNRVILQTADQDYLSLRAGDDYFAVVQRLGEPAADRWRAQSKEVAFRVLDYPQRSYSVVLFGADQASATYIGALDTNWRPVHTVPVGRGVDSSAMLRTLPRF